MRIIQVRENESRITVKGNRKDVICHVSFDATENKINVMSVYPEVIKKLEEYWESHYALALAWCPFLKLKRTIFFIFFLFFHLFWTRARKG